MPNKLIDRIIKFIPVELSARQKMKEVKDLICS